MSVDDPNQFNNNGNIGVFIYNRSGYYNDGGDAYQKIDLDGSTATGNGYVGAKIYNSEKCYGRRWKQVC